MTLDTLKDGDRIYVNGDEYTFHKVIEIDEVPFIRCVKVEGNVPMLVRCADAVQDVR